MQKTYDFHLDSSVACVSLSAFRKPATSSVLASVLLDTNTVSLGQSFAMTMIFFHFPLSKSHDSSHKPRVCKFRVQENPTDTITVMTPVAQ